MDKDAAIGSGGDGRHGCGDSLAVGVEMLEVHDAPALGVIRNPLEQLAICVVPLVVVAEQRQVEHFDPELQLRVIGPLVDPAQVDDALHAVGEQLLSALVRERADVVGAHDGAVPRLCSVLGRQAAEIADVDAAVPVQEPCGAHPTPRRAPPGCPGASATWRR